jgi:hypothetical protein
MEFILAQKEPKSQLDEADHKDTKNTKPNSLYETFALRLRYLSLSSSSRSSGTGSIFRPGTRYFSFTQAPRSMS